MRMKKTHRELSSKVENTFLPMELPFLLFKVNLSFFLMTALDWELYAITNTEFFSVFLIVNSLKTGQCNFYYALFFKFAVPTTAPVPTTGED